MDVEFGIEKAFDTGVNVLVTVGKDHEDELRFRFASRECILDGFLDDLDCTISSLSISPLGWKYSFNSCNRIDVGDIHTAPLATSHEVTHMLQKPS